MLLSIIVTVSIAAAVIGIFCVKAFRLDKCRRKTKSYVLIPFIGNEKQLEMLVKSCYWEEVFARRECSRDVILLIKDDAELPEKASELEQEYSIVHCVRAGDIASFVEQN